MTSIYDLDFVGWTEQQAEALRTAARGGSNQVVDWRNLAEEIEGLGISQRSALGSQIRRIIRLLLKLDYSRASEPRRGWGDSIADARIEMEDLLERSPVLGRKSLARLKGRRNTRPSLLSGIWSSTARSTPRQRRGCEAPPTPRSKSSATGFRQSRLRRHRAQADVRRPGATFAARVPMFNERRAKPPEGAT